MARVAGGPTRNALTAAIADRPCRLTVLGATGSIGRSTLDLVGRNPDLFDIVAVTAQSNAQELAELAKLHRAKVAVIGDEALLGELDGRRWLAPASRAMAGADALVEAASDAGRLRDGGDCRCRRIAADVCGRAPRPPHRARQQGMPGFGGRCVHR